MAELVIGEDEFLRLVSLFPGDLRGINIVSVKDGVFHLKVSLHRFLPKVSVPLKFVSFGDGAIVFKIEKKLAGTACKVLEKLGIGKKDLISFSDGQVILNVQGMLGEKLPWISLEDLVFDGGALRVVFSVKDKGGSYEEKN